VIFASVTAFAEAADILMQAKDGDAINVVGELKMRVYEKNGEWRPAADVLANKVTLLAKPARRRETTNPRRQPNSWTIRSRSSPVLGSGSRQSKPPSQSKG
jgi:single-stranded DNA-binding protein